MYTCVYRDIHAYVNIYISTFIYIYVYRYICIYVYMFYMCKSIYICIYIWLCQLCICKTSLYKTSTTPEFPMLGLWVVMIPPRERLDLARTKNRLQKLFHGH